MKTIILEVSDPAAEKIEKMSPTQKNAISETLSQLITNRRSLEEIMDDLRDQAERNGLTPEILKKLLEEKDGEDNR